MYICINVLFMCFACLLLKRSTCFFVFKRHHFRKGSRVAWSSCRCRPVGSLFRGWWRRVYAVLLGLLLRLLGWLFECLSE